MQPVESTERKQLKCNQEFELAELQNLEEQPSSPSLLVHNSANSIMHTKWEEQNKKSMAANSNNNNNYTQSNASRTIEEEQEYNTSVNNKELTIKDQENTLSEEENVVKVHNELTKKELKENDIKISNEEWCTYRNESTTSQPSISTADCTTSAKCKHTQEKQNEEHLQQQYHEWQQQDDPCNQRISGNKLKLCAHCQNRALLQCNSELIAETASQKNKSATSASKVQNVKHGHHKFNDKNSHDDAMWDEEMLKHVYDFNDGNYNTHNNTVKKKNKHTVEYLLESKSPVCTTQPTSASEWVQLNVGGTMFVTTLTTLEVDPQSILANIAANLRKTRLEQQQYQLQQERLRKEHLERYVLAHKCSSLHYKGNTRKKNIEREGSENKYNKLLSPSSSSSLEEQSSLPSFASCLSSVEEMQHTQAPVSSESGQANYMYSNNNSNSNNNINKSSANLHSTLHECNIFSNDTKLNNALNAFSVNNATQIHHEGEVKDLHNCHCNSSGNNKISGNTSQKKNSHVVNYNKKYNSTEFSSSSYRALSRPFPVEGRTRQVKEKFTEQNNYPDSMPNVNHNKYIKRNSETSAIFALDHDAYNSILLDVDAQYFAPVLNYLRHGTIAIPAGVSVEGVRAVAAYLNVFSLAQKLTPPIPAPLTNIPRRRYLFSWGQGSSGELGSQLLEDVPVPTLVQVTPFKEHVVQMTLGANYTLTRTNRGNVYSFGHGSWGQLGLGNPAELEAITCNRQLLLTVPHRVAFFERHPALYIASGYAFAMAITCDSAQDYHVYFWGNNNHGQSGLGPTFFSTHNKIYTPHKIEALEDKKIIKVCGGSYFSLALSMDGTLYSWGNIECLGLGTPREVEGRFAGTDILAKSWNNEKRSVLLTPQRIHVFAHPMRQRARNLTHNRNNSIRLDRDDANSQTNATIPSRFTDNRTSNINESHNNHNNNNYNIYENEEQHSIEEHTPVLSRMPSSLTSTNVLLSAQSHEITEQQPPPTNTNMNNNINTSTYNEQEDDFEHLESLEEHEENEWNEELSLLLSSPELEEEEHEHINVDVEKKENERLEEEEVKFIHINTGQWHSAAISTTGQLYTWGVGYQGRLGHGSNDSVYTPTLVQGALAGHTLIDVACGSFHTVALTSQGLVFCWGDNDLGQCGVAGANCTQHSTRFSGIHNNHNHINNNNTSPYNESTYVSSSEGLHGSLNAMEAMMTPYRVIGLELIAGGVARGISCGRRHTAVLMSGPQPSCIRNCCNTCEDNTHVSSFTEESLQCCVVGDGEDDNHAKRKQKYEKKGKYFHEKCKSGEVIKSSASHGQVYVFGGVDVVNSTVKHFNNNNNNNNNSITTSNNHEEQHFQYNANNIYNSASTTAAAAREQRRRNSSNNINNYELDNHNHSIRSYINREVALHRSNAWYHLSEDLYAPQQTRSTSSASRFTRPRQQQQQSDHQSPTHHRPNQSHLLHRYNDNDEQLFSELEQDEQTPQVHFSSMTYDHHHLHHHRTASTRMNTNAENDDIMYTFSGGNDGAGGGAIHDPSHVLYHSPSSTLVNRPSSQYKRIQGLEQENITHVMCGLYHTFVFAEDTLPYYETPIDECTSSTMSALTSLHSSSLKN